MDDDTRGAAGRLDRIAERIGMAILIGALLIIAASIALYVLLALAFGGEGAD